MNQLWAPWRMELIRQPESSGCFFCVYANENCDERNLILERSQHCFVIMNRFPYSNGHLMIVPYRHTGELNQLDDEIYSSILKYTARWQYLLTKAIKAQGFNIGINVGKVAGAGVADHLHVHLVPRWLGDTNFMPVLTETKVVNQSLLDLYQQLRTLALTDRFLTISE